MTGLGNQAVSVQPDRRSMWAEPDQDFEGIRRVELPLPFPPGSVNVYLVPQEDGWILLDCGVNVPSVLSAYKLAGIEWTDIRQIILTHVHPDHSGLSARIREVTGAAVRMHRNEQEILWGVSDPEPWLDWQDGILSDAGVPQDMRHNIRGATRELRSFYPDVAADSYIEHGDLIPTALGLMQALLTPGHSRGHLCFYFPERRILLAGDQLLRPNTPHVEWYREGCALDEFRASLKAMAQLDVEWVLPSHGRAYRGHKQRIDSLLEHSLDMEARIRDMVARGMDVPHDLASAAWRVPLPPFEHRNAVFEVLAYLQQPLSF
jgi:glyoxylase-like metal-dependent hydrolase (beta-lactamase superfamily II)